MNKDQLAQWLLNDPECGEDYKDEIEQLRSKSDIIGFTVLTIGYYYNIIWQSRRLMGSYSFCYQRIRNFWNP